MTSRLGQLAVVFGALAVLLAVSGTAGYSSATADRTVSVDVTNDAAAFLGVERNVVNETENSTNVTLTVINRLSTTVDLDVDHRLTESGSAIDTNPNSVEGLRPGERRDVSLSIDCTSTDAEEIELDVHVVGDGIEVDLERSVETRCG